MSTEEAKEVCHRDNLLTPEPSLVDKDSFGSFDVVKSISNEY